MAGARGSEGPPINSDRPALPVLGTPTCGLPEQSPRWLLPQAWHAPHSGTIHVLLMGPYDPHCGEYTFLAPPLGVWRLKGVLASPDISVRVFDPNLYARPRRVLDELLRKERWDIVGVSTTGMTLRYDLELAHHARRVRPQAVLVAGGMEATFRPEQMFELGPFDLVALGEGERPLQSLIRARRHGGNDAVLEGMAHPLPGGGVARSSQSALDGDAFADAVARIPYAEMPFQWYWDRLEQAYRVGDLPHKAAREARLAEVRSVRLITLNYCPMGCSFCSSTNFLHAAKDGRAKIRRLSAEQILTELKRIVADQPGVRTVIFQDDIFVFTSDDRILPLCEGILKAKASGDLPQDLEFISTNRIDAMTEERLVAMRAAGFRVLGFGIESFSPDVLAEFNKARIVPFIEPNLQAALDAGIRPFLDLILTSPRGTLEDLATTLREGFRWLLAGCEMGMYPYVIPFSGSAMADDPELIPNTRYERRVVRGTDVAWDQPAKILPEAPDVRAAILSMEERVDGWLAFLQPRVAHLPSRVRSLLWILSGALELEDSGLGMPDPVQVQRELLDRLPLDGAASISEVERPLGVPAPVRRKAPVLEAVG